MEGSRHGTWARDLLGASGIFITDRVTPAPHQRNWFSDRTVPSCVAVLLQQPPFSCLFSPYLAAASLWVCSIKPSQASPGPGAFDLTDNQAPGVEDGWVVGICHLHEHRGAGYSPPPGLPQLATLAGDEQLLVFHGNDQAARGMSFIIQSLQPAERVSLAPAAPRSARGPSGSALHLLFTLSLIMIKTDSPQPTVKSLMQFPPSPMLAGKSHHPSGGNEKCNKSCSLMKH